MSGLKKYLIFCGLLLMVYTTAQYFKPKPTNWKATYLPEDKIPFGTYILRKQINNLFPNATVKVVNRKVSETLKNRPTGQSNYLIITSATGIDSSDYKEMVVYMRAGNNIFIAAQKLNSDFLDSLKLDIDSNLTLRDKNYINFVNPLLKQETDYHFEKDISERYFSRIDTNKAIVLGKRKNGECNFIKYPFGKGALYILPNPKLLTNYSLLKVPGLDYASKALSYLPKTEMLIWDEYFTRPNKEDQSELRVLFKYDELRWAYYLALFGLVFFIFFEIKRRQRIIPVIETLKNTSVEFTQTVGRVYYQQRNNTDIVTKKISYFLEYLRSKYRMRTVELDNEFKQALIKMTGATEETIGELLEMIKFLQMKDNVSDDQLIRFNQILEKFYKQDL